MGKLTEEEQTIGIGERAQQRGGASGRAPHRTRLESLEYRHFDLAQ